MPVREESSAPVPANKPAVARPEGTRTTPEKENGPASVLRAAANAAVLGRAQNGLSAYAEVNRPATTNRKPATVLLRGLRAGAVR